MLVEDDVDLSRSIVNGLRGEGIDTAGATTCTAARDSLLFAAHDVIVLDVMLPDRTGYEICTFLREGDARGLSFFASPDRAAARCSVTRPSC